MSKKAKPPIIASKIPIQIGTMMSLSILRAFFLTRRHIGCLGLDFNYFSRLLVFECGHKLTNNTKIISFKSERNRS